MRQFHDHYPGIDYTVLRRRAQDWAKDHPLIKKILLFKGKPESDRYVLVVMIPEITDPEDAWYQDYRRFLEWSFGGETCRHVLENLKSAYHQEQKERVYSDIWVWFNANPKEGPPYEFGANTASHPIGVDPATEWVLYDSDEKKLEGAMYEEKLKEFAVECRMKAHQNLPEYFPRLNLKFLTNFAKERWAGLCSELPLERISLYRYSSEYKMPWILRKYVVVFEISPQAETELQPTTEPVIGERSRKKTLKRKKVPLRSPVKSYEELEHATGWLQTVHDPDVYLRLGIDASFSEAYLDRPGSDFIKQWAFLAKTTEEDMPLGVKTDEPYWMLHHAELPMYKNGSDEEKLEEVMFDKVVELGEVENQLEELNRLASSTPTHVLDKMIAAEKLETKLKKKRKELDQLSGSGIPFPNLDTTGVRPAKQIFPCKPGTRWEDITITLVSNDMVRLKTPLGEGLFTYHKLGMEDGRSGDKPTMLWALLKKFAENKERISSKNPEYDPKLPDTAKRLNNHLKGLFGIKERIYRYPYKTKKAYILRFRLDDVRLGKGDDEIDQPEIQDILEEETGRIGGGKRYVDPNE